MILHRRAAANQTTSQAVRAGTLAVPVVAGTVIQQDVPIYLDGLGTVQAFNTVTVHSRVDGELKKVAFSEGQDVRAGDLLAQIDPAPFQTLYEQAVAKKGQDEAQLNLQRVELKRETDLLDAKIDSQDTYDQVAAQVKELEAVVRADQAAIDTARVQLDYTTITAPIDGRIGIRLVDQGNIVHATDAGGIVVIAQLRPISVVFTLPEQDLRKIQARMASDPQLPVIAVGRDNTNALDEGVLAVVDNQIDTTTGTIRLKATFPNGKLRLWPGQFVNARLLLATRQNGIVVPAQVVQRGPDGAYAFVIDDDMTAQMRPVKVAQIEQGIALIDQGLEPGERVVVDGQYKLQPGSKVRIGEAVPPGPANRGGRAGKSASKEQVP